MDQTVEVQPIAFVQQSKFNWSALVTELLIIVIAGILAASDYANFDPYLRVGGSELEYLTRTAYTLGTLVPKKGYLPLWDPYMEEGDPMLENPVSFAFNPFLMWPSVAFGPQNGIKLSIILTAILAGLGGWALGRVLGLGALARLLLALLCIGKGNMYSYLSQGHFALFAVQAYFPWIFVGVIGILRGYRRWPLVLMALAFSLVFWTGLPWYPPALVINICILTAIYAVDIRRQDASRRFPFAIQVAWKKLFLVGLSFVLTLGLAAITFLPLWMTKDLIGTSTILGDFRADLGLVMSQFFISFKNIGGGIMYPDGNATMFYNFVSPLWFVLLISVLIVIIALVRRHLPNMPWRILVAGSVIFVFCVLWGAGRNPIIEWSYEAIPLASQFRHVDRVLGLASLWLAVILALCVDSLWSYLVRVPIWPRLTRLPRLIPCRALVIGSAIALIAISGLASFQVIAAWHDTWGTAFVRSESQWEDYCISWLRRQYPDQPLSVWTLDYKNIYTYYRNDVRHGWVASDFYHARPMPSTIYSGNLLPVTAESINALPEYALGLPHYDDSWLQQHGYKPISESTDPYQQDQPCLYRRDGAYSYAYSVTSAQLKANPYELPLSSTNPITSYARDYDRVGLIAQARTDDDVVVTVQELAYPGWQVFVDGAWTHIESVGRQIGVVLPRDGRQHTVRFQYLPWDFFVGATITLLTALWAVIYLLYPNWEVTGKLWGRFLRELTDAWDLRKHDGN